MLNRLLPLLCLFLVSCTHTFQLHKQNDAYWTEIEEYSKRKTARIALTDSTEIKANQIQRRNRAIYYSKPHAEAVSSTTLDSISTITFNYHAAGATGGFFRGLLYGVISGGTIGYITGKDSYFGRVGTAVFGAMEFGAVGAASGLLYGAVHGDKLIYILPPDSSRSTHHPPPGHRYRQPIK